MGHFRLNAAGKAFFDSPAAADAVVQQMLSRPPSPLADSLVERVVQAGHAVVYPDVMQAPDVPDSVRKVAHLMRRGQQTYALLAVPLFKNSRGLGAISVARFRTGGFSDKEIALLQTFADQAVVAIENARLFNETQEALERQTATAEVLQVVSSSMADPQPVLDKVLDSCARLFRSHLQSVNLLDDDGAIHLAAVKWRDVDDDPAFRAAMQSMNDVSRKVYPIKLSPRALAALQDVRDVLSWSDVRDGPDVPPVVRKTAEAAGVSYAQMMAPLISGDRHIGNITVMRKVHDGFNEKERALLKSFTDQAVVAIQNARLFNQTQEALEQRTATAEILKVVARSPSDVQPVFDAIVVAAPPLVGGFSCVVALREGGLMRLVARTPLGASDDDDSWKERTTPIDGNRLYERAVRDRAPTQIVDIQRDTKTTPEFRAYAQARGFRSAVAIPLLADGEVIGAFSVSCVEPRRFSDRELDLLSTFADQAVIAIRNTRLFNETQEALAHQTASADILRVISSSPTDVQPVFEAIVGTAVKHLGCDLALVQTVSGDTYSPQAMATPAGLAPVPGAQRMPVDPTANFPSRAIVAKTMLHVSDWSAVELPAARAGATRTAGPELGALPAAAARRRVRGCAGAGQQARQRPSTTRPSRWPNRSATRR